MIHYWMYANMYIYMYNYNIISVFFIYIYVYALFGTISIFSIISKRIFF